MQANQFQQAKEHLLQAYMLLEAAIDNEPTDSEDPIIQQTNSELNTLKVMIGDLEVRSAKLNSSSEQ